MVQLTVDIDGMSCGHCVARVKQVTASAPDVKVDDVPVGNASLSCDPALSSPESIVGAVSKAGYPAHIGHPRERWEGGRDVRRDGGDDVQAQPVGRVSRSTRLRGTTPVSSARRRAA